MSNFLPSCRETCPSSLPFFSTFSPLSLPIFLHLFDLSTVKPGPDRYEPRNIVLSRTKYSTSSLSTITMVCEFLFFFFFLISRFQQRLCSRSRVLRVWSRVIGLTRFRTRVEYVKIVTWISM